MAAPMTRAPVGSSKTAYIREGQAPKSYVLWTALQLDRDVKICYEFSVPAIAVDFSSSQTLEHDEIEIAL